MHDESYILMKSAKVQTLGALTHAGLYALQQLRIIHMSQQLGSEVESSQLHVRISAAI